MIIRTAIALCAFVIASPAFAQAVDKLVNSPPMASDANNKDPNKSSLKVQLQLSPSLGKNVVFQEGDTLIDDSGYDASAEFTQPLNSRTKLVIVGGIAGSPEMFDEDAPTSSLYAQAGLETGISKDPADMQGQFLPYIRFRHTGAYDGFIERSTYTENSGLIGVTFADKRMIRCARLPDGCLDQGTAFTATAEVSATQSSDPARERVTPKLTAKLTVGLTKEIDLYVKASLEGRFFLSAQTVAGDPLHDYLFNQSAGLDLGKLFGLGNKISLSVEGALRQRWSNEPTREYSRLYFVPAVTVRHTF